MTKQNNYFLISTSQFLGINKIPRLIYRKENGKEEFITGKIEEQISDIHELSEIAKREPQLAYSAFVYGISKRWVFVARTTPGISEQFRHLDLTVREEFIPAIIGKDHVTDTTHEMFTLPAKMGGLGITCVSETSNMYIKHVREFM